MKTAAISTGFPCFKSAAIALAYAVVHEKIEKVYRDFQREFEYLYICDYEQNEQFLSVEVFDEIKIEEFVIVKFKYNDEFWWTIAEN